ncbi:MAG: hypothetical protein ABJM06_05215 [Gilvibacter sp.]
MQQLLKSLFFIGIMLFSVSIAMAQESEDMEESEGLQGKFGEFSTVTKAFRQQPIDGYNLYVPNSCTSESAPYPILVFLQGGKGVGGPVEKIYNWGLPKMLTEGKSLDSELEQLMLDTFIVIMPHISGGEFFEGQGALKRIIGDVSEQYNVDNSRIYLTGLSRGGYGTWGLADDLKDTFAAIAPLAGGGRGIENYKALIGMPVWVSHNTGDSVVPFSASERVVEKIEATAAYTFTRNTSISDTDFESLDYIFTATESDSHDSWTAFYSSPEVYKWFLKYSKK